MIRPIEVLFVGSVSSGDKTPLTGTIELVVDSRLIADQKEMEPLAGGE